MTDIFDVDSYRDVLAAQLKAHAKERGYRARLAAAAGCHTSFLSQVMNSPVHLTPDQAAGLAQFWGLNEDETEYFFCLVNRERSAGPALRAHLSKKLARLRAANAGLARRLRTRSEISAEHRQLYYSTWQFSAVHILLTIPGMGSPESVAARLHLTLARARELLEVLAAMGLARRGADSRYVVTETSVHIPGNSPLRIAHHLNWRSVAMRAIQGDDADEGLHYSAVHSVARKDFEVLKNLLTDFIRASRAVVAPSPEEELISLQLDLFRV